MKLPTQVLATRDRYLAAFPLWTMPEGEAAESKARAWTIGLAKQIAFEHPNQGYGCKRASPTRPISKDGIAQQVGATLYSFDMLSQAGSGAPTSNANPDAEDVTGQEFEYVEPIDVIALGAVPPPETGGGDGGGSPPVIPYDDALSVQFGQGCNAVYVESGAPMDPGMISVQSQRCAWDYYVGGLTWDQSYTKHINELRAIYSLPPV